MIIDEIIQNCLSSSPQNENLRNLVDEGNGMEIKFKQENELGRKRDKKTNKKRLLENTPTSIIDNSRKTDKIKVMKSNGKKKKSKKCKNIPQTSEASSKKYFDRTDLIFEHLSNGIKVRIINYFIYAGLYSALFRFSY